MIAYNAYYGRLIEHVTDLPRESTKFFIIIIPRHRRIVRVEINNNCAWVNTNECASAYLVFSYLPVSINGAFLRSQRHNHFLWCIQTRCTLFFSSLVSLWGDR